MEGEERREGEGRRQGVGREKGRKERGRGEEGLKGLPIGGATEKGLILKGAAGAVSRGCVRGRRKKKEGRKRNAYLQQLRAVFGLILKRVTGAVSRGSVRGRRKRKEEEEGRREGRGMPTCNN